MLYRFQVYVEKTQKNSYELRIRIRDSFPRHNMQVVPLHKITIDG